MVSKQKKKINCFCLLFLCSLVYSCNNSINDQHFESQNIDTDNLLIFDFQDQFNDTLILNRNRIINLHIPFKIDTFYKNSTVCGNELKYHFYKNKSKNITIEVSQQTYDIPIHSNHQMSNKDSVKYKMTLRDSLHAQRHIDNYLNSYKDIFDHEIENKVIVSQKFYSQNKALWKIYGNEIATSEGQKTIEITCINTESFNTNSILTVVQLFFVETELSKEETLNNSIYICNKLFE